MEISAKEAQRALVGGFGTLHIIDTTAHAGNFWLVQALEATVLNVATTIDGTAVEEAINMGDDTVLRANFTSVKLTSGSALAVRSKPA